MARPQNTILAGTAVVDITPPIGYRMSGYFYERLSTGAANPLYAKALVLRQGDQRLALVFCDLIGVPAEISSQARRQAAEKTGIPAAHILVAGTHSHTGPLYFGALRRHFHEQAMAKGGSDPQEQVDYAADLTAGIVRAVAEADAAARPARLEAGAAQQAGLAFNRRYHMNDGSVRFNPGPLNPDIVRPAGPTDPQVGIVLVRDAGDARPAAAVVNFAMHLDTTGGTLYAADYPYHIEQALRQALGERFTLLFGTGTCGDINHVDITKKERPKSDAIGRTLAATVQAALPGLKAVASPALAARSETVRVPLQRYTPEQLAKAREDIRKVGARQLAFLAEVETCRILSLELCGGDTMPLEVQAFRLGKDVAIVGLPGEFFVEFGLKIKKASPARITLVVGLAGGSVGYVPTPEAFKQGGYEPTPWRYSKLAPESGAICVGSAVRQLECVFGVS